MLDCQVDHSNLEPFGFGHVHGARDRCRLRAIHAHADIMLTGGQNALHHHTARGIGAGSGAQSRHTAAGAQIVCAHGDGATDHLDVAHDGCVVEFLNIAAQATVVFLA